ncbi:MAG: TetR/AcrR family transcriptional regulator [Calditrichaceae bacterium]|nr:TetR/AcrR family transcriptional regulator [Calditrichaceae bacterium]MBN2708045.1 TetR/AcrR family transcriptional regulator [Calditrichaceae bacterium]RQV95168.1 MAG: TetR/AcrR family transcriptional regulator [Calditrichota bacterium]
MVNNPKDSNTEEKILHTAMEVFVEKGLLGARMQEIADRAGINKALLHYYFRTKERLYSHIFQFILKKSAGDIIELLNSNLPFEDLLKNFISKYIDIVHKNHRIPLFIMKELSSGGNTVKEVVKNVFNIKNTEELPAIRIFKNAMEEGRIVTMDPRQIIITVIGACLFYFIGEPIIRTILIDENNFDRDQFIKERKKAVFDIVYYGLVPRGENK